MKKPFVLGPGQRQDLFAFGAIGKECYAQALAGLIDAQHRQPLAAPHCGTGTTSSSDAQFFRAGARGEVGGLVNLHYGRRYPTLAAFLHQSVEEITDEVVDLYDRCLAQTYARAGRQLDEFRLAIAKATNEKVLLFRDIGHLVLDPFPNVAGNKRINVFTISTQHFSERLARFGVKLETIPHWLNVVFRPPAIGTPTWWWRAGPHCITWTHAEQSQSRATELSWWPSNTFDPTRSILTE